MRTYIGLLRGINVGGRHKLPMADLRAICESGGLVDVQTYIQSGNLAFRSTGDAPAISAGLESDIESRFGFRPKVMVLEAEEVREAARHYPFPVDEPKFAHVMFLEAEPDKEAVESLNAIDHAPDRVEVEKGVVYIYLPNGISGARTDTKRIERVLGVSGTTRNWRTVQRLVDMTS